MGILARSKDVASQRQVHSSPSLRVMGVEQGGAQAPVNLLQLQKMLWEREPAWARFRGAQFTSRANLPPVV